MTKWITGCLVLAMLAAVGGAIAVSQDKEEVTIKDVMKKAHAGGGKSLLSRVQSGKASDDDKKMLLELYQALAKNKPPKGDEEGFKKRAEALVDAAQAAVDGKKDAGKQLKKAADCKGCHSNHKV
jgi:hypothetical protein